MINLDGTPYLIESSTEKGLISAIQKLQDRVELLRSTGSLSPEALRAYYGEKRFEQVAESNALEGSTLSVGETELAIIKGITVTGHDPAYIRDAISLDKALRRISELAHIQIPTNIEQLLEIHSLILADRSGSGAFRNIPVRLSGSEHRPPKTWESVIMAMEDWEKWSTTTYGCSPVIRAAVLHAWLSHIHPFIDGNGRTARAISNLEFIRSGLPPIIIRKKERDRYLEMLRHSDTGDIGPFLDFVISRTEGALLALERAASKHDKYDPIQAKILQSLDRRRVIWNTSLSLLQEMLVNKLQEVLERHKAKILVRKYTDPLSLEDYIELCNDHSIGQSWAFRLQIEIPGLAPLERLAWVGFRSDQMRKAIDSVAGPSIYWSKPRSTGYPYWERATIDAPGASEMTTRQGNGDEWFFSDPITSEISETTTSNLVRIIANACASLAAEQK